MYGYKKIGDSICPVCGVSFEVTTRYRNKVHCSVKCSKTGIRNPSFKKDGAVSLGRLHRQIEQKLGRPDRCSCCGKQGKVDLANISNEYKAALNDWEWLCRRCHMQKDGRLEETRQRGFASRKIIPIKCIICENEFMPSRSSTRLCSNKCVATFSWRIRKAKHGKFQNNT